MSVYSLDDAVGEIPSEIKEQLLNLHSLDAELADLEFKLNETRKQRDAVYRPLELFCELRAPIRRVPYEILATVFYYYPELQDKRNSTLMRVCKLWRQILMDTPRLWNRISLDLRKIEDLPLLWDYARICLIHSGTLPLYINLDARTLNAKHSLSGVGEYIYYSGHHSYVYGRESYAGITLRPFIDLLEREGDAMRIYECALLMTMAILRGEDDRFIKRWRNFHCYTGGTYYESETPNTMGARLWDSVDGDTDNLLELKITPSYSNNENWDPTGFPNLKSLKVFSTSLDISLDLIGLPVGTLEQLILFDALSSESFLDFPSGAFASLQLLQLEFFKPVPSDSRLTIHLPALKVLALSGLYYGAISRLFDTPRLTHLGLVFNYLPPAGHEVPSLLNTVTDLMLTLPRGDNTADLRLLLSSAPSVRRLHVRRHRYATQDVSPFFEGMMADLAPTVYCTENPAHWPYIIPTWDSKHAWGDERTRNHEGRVCIGEIPLSNGLRILAFCYISAQRMKY